MGSIHPPPGLIKPLVSAWISLSTVLSLQVLCYRITGGHSGPITVGKNRSVYIAGSD